MKLDWNVLLETDSAVEEYKGSENWEKGPLHILRKFPEGRLLENRAVVSIRMEADDRVYMNGYQSWTVSEEKGPQDRLFGIHGMPPAITRQYKLDRYGDYHFHKYSGKKGQFHGYSWCWFRHGDTCRFFGSLFEDNGYTVFDYDASAGELVIRKDNELVHVSGDTNIFDLYYAEGNLSDIFDGWFYELGVTPRTREQIAGYSSWYNRYQDISNETIMEDLEGCRKLLKPNDLFQIDDGWEPFIGDWLQADEKKFPEGMKKAADDIHDAGFLAGLWLAPFVAETNSSIYKDHQDWFLKVNGKNWSCGSNWSGFYSLDIDNPEVTDYIRRVFHTVFDEWGYDLVKLDFLYGAAPFGTDDESRAGRMTRAMRFLREVCGDKLILGCGVPLMPAFGIVDYCRIGSDVSLNWDDAAYMRLAHRERVSTKNSITNTLNRGMLNGRAWYNDPDVFFLREDNIQLDQEEKEDLIKLDALLGGVYLTSDNPDSYTQEQRETYYRMREIADAELIHAEMKQNKGIEVLYREKDGTLKNEVLFAKRFRRRRLPRVGRKK